MSILALSFSLSCREGAPAIERQILDAVDEYEQALRSPGESKDGPLRAWRHLERVWDEQATALVENCPDSTEMRRKVDFLRFWTYSMYFYIPEEPGEPVGIHLLEERGVSARQVEDAYSGIDPEYLRDLASEVAGELDPILPKSGNFDVFSRGVREFFQWKYDVWGAAGKTTLESFRRSVAESTCFARPSNVDGEE